MSDTPATLSSAVPSSEPSGSSPSPSTPATETAPAAPAAFDPQRPLGNLAVSLSGGGYRAAAFHLGSLSLMDRVGLLPGVVGLSTVSGGTICGMAWVVSLIEGKSFDDFYKSFSRYLIENNVIGLALDGLTAERRSGQWASLIRAAANVYARDNLFGDRRFGDVLKAPGLQFEEAIFNSTEFHTGLDFRFRRSTTPRTLVGNRNYPVPRDVAQHIRLADIVAASSCFPGGFEPLVFPQQFRWPAAFPLQSAVAKLGKQFQGGLPLMDGGIYDNQGVGSLLQAFDKSSATTLVISDVSARDRRMYDVPATAGSRGWLTLKWIWRLALLLVVLALASAGVLAWDGFQTARHGDWRPMDYLLYLVPGALAAGVGIGLWWARRRVKEANRLLEKTVDVEAWPRLKELTVPEFTQMLTLRITSLLALTSKVFMARIRRLVFGRVFDNEKYKGKRIANLIYAMDTPEPTLFAEHPWLRPNDPLVTLARTAEKMATTLWFTEESEFTTQKQAGEATICYVLLKHIVEDHEGRYEVQGSPLHELFRSLRAEWDRFNASAPAPSAAPPASGDGSGKVSIWGT
jgi:predicted acylesterase/phospholipase RssA